MFRPGRDSSVNPGLIEHDIRTGDQVPIKQRAHHTSPDKRHKIDIQVMALLEDGIIEESRSLWYSPVISLRKRRFCVDYRKLNSVTIKDSHPLPRVDNILDAIAGSRWFRT